jgi:hypothetical protein
VGTARGLSDRSAVLEPGTTRTTIDPIIRRVARAIRLSPLANARSADPVEDLLNSHRGSATWMARSLQRVVNLGLNI